MVLGIVNGKLKWSSKKQERKLAKLLLNGDGCRNCEKCAWHETMSQYVDTLKLHSETICMIVEGTPYLGICKYWSRYRFGH